MTANFPSSDYFNNPLPGGLFQQPLFSRIWRRNDGPDEIYNPITPIASDVRVRGPPSSAITRGPKTMNIPSSCAALTSTATCPPRPGLDSPDDTDRGVVLLIFDFPFKFDYPFKYADRVKKRGQGMTETPDAADAFDHVMRKEGEMHDSRKAKNDSPVSLPAGSVRRVLPGRGGLPGIVAATGLALLLSACGGGGAGAPNAGAALGGSALSIQADAAVAPAPVAEQATPVAQKTAPMARNSPPDARETPPPNPQAETSQTRNLPPDAKKATPVAKQAVPDAEQASPVTRNSLPGDGEPPPPTDLPSVDETIPPPMQEPPTPTDGGIVADPSTIPFLSGSPVTDETTNMNAFGVWGSPAYQPGGSRAHQNNGPNVAVRRRVGYAKRLLTLPVSGGTGESAYTSLYYGTVAIADLWLTYPADAGDGDLAVHIRTRRETPGGYGSISDDAATSAAIRRATGLDFYYDQWPEDARSTEGYPREIGHNGYVLTWLKDAAGLGPHYGFTVKDHFLTEAYLQAPGSGVQPAAQGSETSATWTGKAIAFENHAGSPFRGYEIGGAASVTVNFGSSLTVDVSLTDLRSGRITLGGVPPPNGGFPPHRYPNQRWTGLTLTGGAFSDTAGGRSIKGVFRSQVSSTGTNANTVGGIFDVKGTMKGGFVATFAPPSPD